jgi:hypothetical protein
MRNHILGLSVLVSLFLACGGNEPQPQPPVASSGSAPIAPVGSAPPAASSAPIKVRILAFNDFHGNLKPPTNKLPK